MHIHTPSPWSRRRFFSTAAGSALLPFVPSSILAQDDDLVTVSVLHTTDLHGHIVPTQTYPEKDGSVIEDVGGLARCVTQIRAWQKENPNNLLLDIGDLYQGTHVSLATQGQLMMRLLNSMNYDGWVIGNHELDWGLDKLAAVVKTSTVPVLGSNCKHAGQWTNRLDAANPLSKVAPYVIKEIAGFKIGVIGTVTPGLPYWLAPRLLQEFSAEDPVKSINFAMKQLRAEKVDAIVLASHMGLKGPGRPDDFANRIMQIADDNVGVDVIIAGHTHKDLPNQMVRGVPYTQANYYGIHCGKVDLVFSKSKRRLIAVNPITKLMDKSVAQDPMILSASAKEREGSEKELTREIGSLKEGLAKAPAEGQPPESIYLLTKALLHCLKKRNVAVDAVLHGAFYELDVKPGKKTIADAWDIVPYENYLATASFSPEELKIVLEECITAPYSSHVLDGLKASIEGTGKKQKVTDITLPDGKPLDPKKRYRIALNSYDMQSGGNRYTKLNEIAYSKAAAAETFDVQSREALIEFFTEKKEITRKDLGLT
jgi:2',3'-cyclic-nucleotide 2'-phosphodiesterase (5'-nucleotidase family)